MSGRRLVVLMCAVEALSMSGFATFATLLPEFSRAWHLSNTEAGWISAIYFAGYVAAVPVLVGYTDRFDARSIYLLGLAAAAGGNFGYAWLAHGFWGALLFRALAGVGLAGTYMPGLRLLTDRLDSAGQIRAVPWYTGFFSVGTSLSYFVAGTTTRWLDWHGNFALAGAAPVFALALVAALVPARAPAPSGVRRSPLDFRPVLRERRLLGWCLMYGGHTWELMAMRAWLVAYLVFAMAHAGEAGAWNAGTITSLVVLCGMPASVFTAEVALRRDRRAIVRRVMLASVALSLVFGAASALPFAMLLGLAFLYNAFIMGDSGTITAGAVEESSAEHRGAMLAVYSLIGFSGGIVGPLAVGVVLDTLGGSGSALAWAGAMATVGAGSLLGLVAMRLARRE